MCIHFLIMYFKICKILRLEYNFTLCTLLSDGELYGGLCVFSFKKEEVKMYFLDYT